MSLRTDRGENTFLKKGSFPLELPFFQRLLLPLSRTAHAVTLCCRIGEADAARDSGNKSLWKEKGAWGERRTFPRKGVLSPQAVRKGEQCNSWLPHAGPHLRERHQIRVYIVDCVLGSLTGRWLFLFPACCPRTQSFAPIRSAFRRQPVGMADFPDQSLPEAFAEFYPGSPA